MAFDQELITVMVVGRCFFSEGMDMHMDYEVSRGGGWPKMALHVADLLDFGGG